MASPNTTKHPVRESHAERRMRINDQARLRYRDLQDAMDELRKLLPGNGWKLNRLETLRMACNYIKVLKTTLEEIEREKNANQQPAVPPDSTDMIFPIPHAFEDFAFKEADSFDINDLFPSDSSLSVPSRVSQ